MLRLILHHEYSTKITVFFCLNIGIQHNLVS